MSREQYIIDLAIVIAHGFDDPTCTDEEYREACEFLQRAEIRRVPELTMVAGAGDSDYPF